MALPTGIKRMTDHKLIKRMVDDLYGSSTLEGNIILADSAGNGDYATITLAQAAASAGDTILIKGSFSEAVLGTKAGVRYIGIGTGPNMAKWTMVSLVSSAANGWCLKLSAANCYVENIKFTPPAYLSSGVPTAINLDTGSDYTTVKNCLFQGTTSSYKAIYGLVPVDNVRIEGCKFKNMNTASNGAAIYMPASAGVACSYWNIDNCEFNSCVTAINLDGRSCRVTGCTITEYGLKPDGTFPYQLLACGIDLSGTDTGCNMVTKNTLAGAYTSTLYKPGTANDCWFGNWVPVTGTTATSGFSILPPA